MHINNLLESFDLKVNVQQFNHQVIYLLSQNGNIVYVGISSNSGVFGRIKSHKKDKSFDSYYVWETFLDRSGVESLEKGMIAFMRPKYNKACNYDDVAASKFFIDCWNDGKISPGVQHYVDPSEFEPSFHEVGKVIYKDKIEPSDLSIYIDENKKSVLVPEIGYVHYKELIKNPRLVLVAIGIFLLPFVLISGILYFLSDSIIASTVIGFIFSTVLTKGMMEQTYNKIEEENAIYKIFDDTISNRLPSNTFHRVNIIYTMYVQGFISEFNICEIQKLIGNEESLNDYINSISLS